MISCDFGILEPAASYGVEELKEVYDTTVAIATFKADETGTMWNEAKAKDAPILSS